MQFTVAGLGPIKEASIDMGKRLTVFCGPNNTGKTYLSYIVYALASRGIFFFVRKHIKFSEKLIIGEYFDLDFHQDELWDYCDDAVHTVFDHLDEIFGLSSEKAQVYFSDFKLLLENNKKHFWEKILDKNFDISVHGVGIIKKPNESKVVISVIDERVLRPPYNSWLDTVLLPSIYAYLLFHPVISATIFPVERNSIYTFSKELSLKRNKLIDELHEVASKKIDPTDYILKRTTRYPLPIRDGLEVAEDIANIQKTKSKFYPFAEDIEKELLRGEISVTQDGEVQFVSDSAKTKQLPIHLTASIVKTLSSLVFYLKHQAKEEDLLIIDEPELNLHPDNQILLARIFARMINNGLRLLISTHSDYIIREINNLIMLSSDKQEIKKLSTDFGYQSDEYILPDDINAYLFNYKSKTKVEVKQIPLTVSGFDVETIDRTINDLNARSEELFYTLTYGNE